MIEWNDVNNKLPSDDEEIIYVVAYWPPNYFDEEPPTREDLLLDFGHHYGNNHWKNGNWEKIIVKYWMEIPEIP